MPLAVSDPNSLHTLVHLTFSFMRNSSLMRKPFAFMKVHLSNPCICYCDLQRTITTSIIKRPTIEQTMRTVYFLAAAASSAFSLARFSRLPSNLASLLASRNFLYAPPSTGLGKSFLLISLMVVSAWTIGMADLRDVTVLALDTSSLEASPFLC